ncbi:putative NEDD4-like E3 ubiquitin-protein ligase WWP1 [Trypanosoma rangeli]|uniref:Putative NEDD4-like E3 ubiquitin-protein ligase WWP1 n=1 Tax=Trypanosoma rangeli TaxID=5698 RepID=A0A3R7LE31_TRYRA|nr:putative NEDD4-like E3 ubiquitin-protein ligase WWP1 [Trypanosoma rangeli]RNE95447.1 putative NEDD4-like E3 ubiquitin-protein ligase WWP1 [Trypanosoma rangeli]|eukprot:RNE95447.1 putative NEDD4-like E3 ubiquitin-protein ligase WWP1 [Trypanosoma rangeli]
MINLFVDGDYFLTGMAPTSEEAVRGGVDNMLNAIETQLFASTGTAAVEQRIVFFSSSVLKALEEEQSQCQVLITALRRLRFQTIVLDNIPSRAGSPVDAAICTRTMSILAKTHGGRGNNTSEGGAKGEKFLTLVYFAANAYIASALEWAHNAGCGVCFVVYDGDSVADELMAYVSPTYGSGGGIATMTKGEGINFIPNTEAASAALAALQNEGKELPLSVLVQLKQLQQRLTGMDVVMPSTRNTNIKPGTQSSTLSLPSAPVRGTSALPSVDASSCPHPPPIEGSPNPFLPDDNTLEEKGRHMISTKASAPALSSAEERELDRLTSGTMKTPVDGANKAAPVVPGADPVSQTSTATALAVDKPTETATPPVSVAMNTALSLPPTPASVTDVKQNTATGCEFLEPDVSTRLPAGWSLMYDRQRRRHYFVHADARGILKTTWNHPGGFEDQMDLDCQVEEWYRKQREQCQVGGIGKNVPHAHAASVPSATTAGGGGEVASVATDWDECVDPASGRKYYVNRQTKQTSWTLPKAVTGATSSNTAGAAREASSTSMPIAPDTTPLPPFWEERLDPKSGRKFYVNHQTRETTWTHPLQAHAMTPQRAQQSHTGIPVRTIDPNPGPHALPPFWEKRIDPTTGRPFYINHQTRETTWTAP